MSDSFFTLVLQGRETPSAFEKYIVQWEVDNEGKSLAEYLGITEEDLHDIQKEGYSFDFVLFRTVYRKHSLTRIFPGTYVQFAVEYQDEMEPHWEFGWVDSFDKDNQMAQIQCDDCYWGLRCLNIPLRDILQVLPTKERPNIFFKAMLCKECHNCSKESGEFIEECPFFPLFVALKQNRMNSKNTVGEHLGYEKSGRSSSRAQNGAQAAPPKQDDIPS